MTQPLHHIAFWFIQIPVKGCIFPFRLFRRPVAVLSNLCDAIPLRWPTVLIIWWDVYRGTKENDFQSFTSNEISTSIRTPGPSHKALHHHMVSLTWHTSNVFCSLSLWSRIPDKRLSIPCPSVWEFDNDMRLGDDTLYVGWLWNSFCGRRVRRRCRWVALRGGVGF